MNAVIDALSDYGIKHIDMPLTPERVWRAIQDAKGESGVKLISLSLPSCAGLDRRSRIPQP